MGVGKKFGSEKMKNRKTNRLERYDYSQGGCYFVTICVKERQSFFGEIIQDGMVLNQTGVIVNSRWQWLSERYEYVELDEYVVMPNHFHGILIIQTRKDRSRPVPTDALKIQIIVGIDWRVQDHVIETYTRKWLCLFSMATIILRPRYPQRDELNRIREYIQNNPLKWSLDEYNPINQAQP